MNYEWGGGEAKLKTGVNLLIYDPIGVLRFQLKIMKNNNFLKSQLVA